MRTCIYARKSTHKLGQKETIENQIKICRTKANMLGLEIVDIKHDVGTGTDDLNRPEIKKLIQDAIDGNYECVIMKGISRLFRDTEKGLGLIKQLDRHDIRVVTVEEMFDSGDKESRTGTGKLDLSRITMYLMFSEMESKKLADRVKYTQIEKAKSGEWNQASSPPYGYDFESSTKKLKVNYLEAEVVKLIFEMYLKGSGLRTIMHFLNGNNPENRLYLKPKHAQRWDQTTMGFILKNQAYVGDIVYNKRSKKERVYKNPLAIGKSKDDIYIGNDFNDKKDWIISPDAHEAIVSRKEFEDVQKIISTKASRKGIRNNVSLLAGLGKCGLCGATITFKRGNIDKSSGKRKSRNNYYCSNYIKYGKTMCDSYHIRCEELEKKIIDHFWDLYTNPKLLDKVTSKQSNYEIDSNATSDYLKEKQDIESELNKLTSKMDKLLEKNLNGEITDQQFTAMNKKYSDELEQLSKILEEVILKISDTTEEDDKIGEFRKAVLEFKNWDNLTFEQKRYLLLRLMSKFVIYPEDDFMTDIYYKYQSLQ